MEKVKAPRRAWIEWLYAELPSLEAEGLLAPGGAEGIRRRYGEPRRRSGVGAALILFAVLGALSVGLGAILLFARNWGDLGRPERLILALLPLTASLGISAFVLAKRASSAAWREGGAVLNLLCLLGALALIGQTYHWGGDIDGLLLPWLLLSLPLVYLLSSLSAWILWMVGASLWACVAQDQGGQAAFYWVFLIAALPAFFRDFREDPRGPRVVSRAWTLILSLSLCLGISLEKVMPGLWIIIYPAFFSVLATVDLLWLEDDAAPRPALSAPFRSAGFLGLVTLSFILSYAWPWEDIGWRNWRGDDRFIQNLAWMDFLVCGLFLLSSLALSAMAAHKRKFRHFGLNLLPLIAAASYLLISALSGGGEALDVPEAALGLVNLLMNGFVLYAGIVMIISGSRRRSAADLNLGAAIIALLVVLRFIFSEGFMEGYLARGLAFMGIGAFFLGMNIVLSRKFREDKEAAE